MPMLGMYYYFMGLYAIYISSDSDSSESSITSSSGDEGENDRKMIKLPQIGPATQVALSVKVWSACNTSH